MGVYALAFIAFTLDLARRSARAEVVAESGAERIARARAAGGSVATLEKPAVASPPPRRAPPPPPAPGGRPRQPPHRGRARDPRLGAPPRRDRAPRHRRGPRPV